ncbi:MAG: hemerythrin family protein [Rhodocyclales bacterium]|nr:hemerythrin family protein [Rhodocyclales bacterium]
MDNKYLLGIEELDSQHTAVFAMLGELQNACAESAAPEMLGALAKKLADFLGAHFDHEESFMGAIDLPNRAEHKQQHLELAVLLGELVAQCAQTPRVGELEQTLLESLSTHLLRYDAEIGHAVEHLVTRLRSHEAEERLSPPERR